MSNLNLLELNQIETGCERDAAGILDEPGNRLCVQIVAKLYRKADHKPKKLMLRGLRL